MDTRQVPIASCVALATALLAAPAFAGDVSVSIGEPGFYGRIDIGGAPAPSVIYAQPMVVVRTQEVEPLYLHVPLGYASDWKSHCAEYGACGRPVYFVQDNWYNDVYVPHYRKNHGHGGEKGHGEGHGHGHGHGD